MAAGEGWDQGGSSQGGQLGPEPQSCLAVQLNCPVLRVSEEAQPLVTMSFGCGVFKCPGLTARPTFLGGLKPRRGVQICPGRPEAGEPEGLSRTLSVGSSNASLSASPPALRLPLPRCRGNGAALAPCQGHRLKLLPKPSYLLDALVPPPPHVNSVQELLGPAAQNILRAGTSPPDYHSPIYYQDRSVLSSWATLTSSVGPHPEKGALLAPLTPGKGAGD